MSFSTTRRWPRPCVRTWQRELCCFATAPFPATTSWPRSQGSWRKRRSDSELFDQIFGICGASLSATSRAAGGALYLLYTHPEQLDQLIRNPALIPDALEECFRLASNGYFTFPRIATRDTEVGGTPILKGMVVTIEIAVLVVITGIALGLALALIRSLRWRLLNIPIVAFVDVARALPPLVLIEVWAYLLQPSTGLVDQILGGLGLPRFSWFADPHLALVSILLIGFPWIANLGFLIFLGGLQNLPKDVLDAARLDGVSAVRRVFAVDIPLLMPQFRIVVILSGIFAVQNFVPILLLTNGGPGTATMVPGLDMYQSAFQNDQYGYGMAIGTLLFVAMLIFTLAVMRALRPRTT